MSYIEETERHQVYIARLATNLLNRHVFPSLTEAAKAARLILLDAENLQNMRQRQQALSRVGADVRRITAAALDEVTAELEDIAVYEAQFSAGLVAAYAGKEVVAPAAEKVKAYLAKAVMDVGTETSPNAGLWSQFVNAQVAENADKFDSVIRAGVQSGETVQEISKKLRMLSEGLLKQHSETLVRTGVQHYTQQASNFMAQENKDVIDREVPIVTFDNRTSQRCIGYAERYFPKGWPVGESPIGYPPYHPNCRSRVVAVSAGFDFESGTKAAVGGQKGEEAADKFEARKERAGEKPTYRGKRDSEIFKAGQIKADTQYGEWLRKQPSWYIESTLGKKKAALFMKGGLPLEKFTDLAGNPLTLAELRELHPVVFKRAGL